MSISPRRFILLLAAAALLVGVVALSAPINAGSVDCGTGWSTNLLTAQSRDTQAAVSERYGLGYYDEEDSLADHCSSVATVRRAWAWPLVGLGVLGVLGSLFVRRQEQSSV